MSEKPDPDPLVVRRAREAEGYYELGLYEDALERAESLTADPSLSGFALGMRAECLRSLERYEEGVGAYEEVLDRERENVSAYVGLGWCLKRSGRLDLALDAMERMLAACPAEPIGLYNLACYCALAGQRDRVVSLLARAIRGDERYRELAKEETDFDPVREEPEFRQLIEGATP